MGTVYQTGQFRASHPQAANFPLFFSLTVSPTIGTVELPANRHHRMDNKQLGLFRLVTYEDRQNIESTLNVSFEDIYDSIDSVRSNVRQLEKEIDAIFHGASHGKTEDD
jgi:hypothetical protein